MNVKIKHVTCDNNGRHLYLLGVNVLVLLSQCQIWSCKLLKDRVDDRFALTLSTLWSAATELKGVMYLRLYHLVNKSFSFLVQPLSTLKMIFRAKYSTSARSSHVPQCDKGPN